VLGQGLRCASGKGLARAPRSHARPGEKSLHSRASSGYTHRRRELPDKLPEDYRGASGEGDVTGSRPASIPDASVE
jgi:hypothetical protein